MTLTPPALDPSTHLEVDAPSGTDSRGHPLNAARSPGGVRRDAPRHASRDPDSVEAISP